MGFALKNPNKAIVRANLKHVLDFTEIANEHYSNYIEYTAYNLDVLTFLICLSLLVTFNFSSS